MLLKCCWCVITSWCPQHVPRRWEGAAPPCAAPARRSGAWAPPSTSSPPTPSPRQPRASRSILTLTYSRPLAHSLSTSPRTPQVALVSLSWCCHSNGLDCCHLVLVATISVLMIWFISAVRIPICFMYCGFCVAHFQFSICCSLKMVFISKYLLFLLSDFMFKCIVLFAPHFICFKTWQQPKLLYCFCLFQH